MCSQKASSFATAAAKSSANVARQATLIAPADVPHRIGKGLRLGLPRMSRTALTTPTW
jgi:hypothetical protein